MVWSLLQVIAGLVMLYFGGEALVRGASALAARMGISALAIGLTVVAFGTSAPELVVSLDAALSGANDISVGNVVGSNIANIALILGIACLIRPALVQAKVVRFDAPLLVVASLGVIAILSTGGMSRTEGGILLACLVGYTAFTFWEARRDSKVVREEFASAAPAAPARMPVAALLVIVGFALLVLGGQTLVGAAVELAAALGISEAVIGLTIVAFGTSLPEFATSVIASLRGQGDIAVGNVVGSNLFNLLGILGVTAVVRPLQQGGITPVDLGAMAALALLLALVLVARRRLERTSAVLFLAAGAGYLGWLFVA